MGNYIGDTTLGLNSVAWAVLHLLAGTSVDYPRDDPHGENFLITTRPLCNGRERGFLLCVQNLKDDIEILRIFCAEARSSDEILVLAWHSKDHNPNPEIPDEDIWRKNIKYFKENEIRRATNSIRDIVNNFVKYGNFMKL